jgi:hypothetical protein
MRDLHVTYLKLYQLFLGNFCSHTGSFALKGQCHDIFNPRFFRLNISPGPLIKGLMPFRI